MYTYYQTPTSIGYIYLIVDCQYNKVYVGQSTNLSLRGINCYYGSGTIISKIIKKRKHHLEKRILGYCDTLEELIEAETECIYFYRAYGSDGENYDEVYGYNLLKIGESRLGFKHSGETKQKMKTKRLGYGNPMYGKNIYDIWTEKYGKKMALRKIIEHKKNLSKACSSEKNGMYGKTIYNVWTKKHGVKEADKRYKKWMASLHTRNLYNEKNGMYGKSVRDIWVEKYGAEEANKLWGKRNLKHSCRMSGKNNPHYRKDLDENIAHIKQLKNEGISLAQIAKQFNCSVPTIKAKLKLFS